MATVNSGSRVVLRFTGRHVAVTFDQSTVTHPPQLYVRLDRGRPALYTVDRHRLDLSVRPGVHTLEITVKDVDERANRSTPPLRSGLLLTGFRLDRRTVSLRLPAGARDLFVYVSPDLAPGTPYRARLTVPQGGRTLTDEAAGLPHLAFIPWNRLHVNLSGTAPVTAISVSVRAGSTSDSGPLSFQLDDVGWTNVHGG